MLLRLGFAWKLPPGPGTPSMVSPAPNRRVGRKSLGLASSASFFFFASAAASAAAAAAAASTSSPSAPPEDEVAPHSCVLERSFPAAAACAAAASAAAAAAAAASSSGEAGERGASERSPRALPDLTSDFFFLSSAFAQPSSSSTVSRTVSFSESL